MNSNPYLPPTEIDNESPEIVPEHDSGSSQIRSLYRWSLVLLLNLIMPLMLASGMLRSSGLVGVLVAVCLAWLFGWWICHRWPQMGRRLIAGGWVVCCSQLFPLIQILAGLAAFSLAEELGVTPSLDSGPKGPHLESEFACGLITLVTGGILMAVSLGIGAIVIGVLDHFRKPKLA